MLTATLQRPWLLGQSRGRQCPFLRLRTVSIVTPAAISYHLYILQSRGMNAFVENLGKLHLTLSPTLFWLELLNLFFNLPKISPKKDLMVPFLKCLTFSMQHLTSGLLTAEDFEHCPVGIYWRIYSSIGIYGPGLLGFIPLADGSMQPNFYSWHWKLCPNFSWVNCI